jgi:hypothetical protein
MTTKIDDEKDRKWDVINYTPYNLSVRQDERDIYYPSMGGAYVVKEGKHGRIVGLPTDVRPIIVTPTVGEFAANHEEYRKWKGYMHQPSGYIYHPFATLCLVEFK